MRPRLSMRFWTSRDQGGTDPYGGGQNYQPSLSDEPCYWWVTSGRAQVDDSRSVVLAEEHMFVDRRSDLKAGDRIMQLVDHEGRLVFDASDYREVEHVAIERDFLDCSLKASS